MIFCCLLWCIMTWVGILSHQSSHQATTVTALARPRRGRWPGSTTCSCTTWTRCCRRSSCCSTPPLCTLHGRWEQVTALLDGRIHHQSYLMLSNLSDVKVFTLEPMQVCHQWNQFILERLWGSRVGRRILQRRLEDRWRGGRPFVSSKDFWDSMVIQVGTDKTYWDNPFKSEELQ